MIPEYFEPKKTPEGIWSEYSRGRNFNYSIDLYETVKRNERFISGDQWLGVKAPDIDKPVLNFLNRTVACQVVQAKSDRYPKGMAGLMAPMQQHRISTPYFDNLRIYPIK